jgi:hypothetical protein
MYYYVYFDIQRHKRNIYCIYVMVKSKDLRMLLVLFIVKIIALYKVLKLFYVSSHLNNCKICRSIGTRQCCPPPTQTLLLTPPCLLIYLLIGLQPYKSLGLLDNICLLFSICLLLQSLHFITFLWLFP